MIYLGQDPIGISNIPESYPELVQNVAALNEEIISKAPVVYREASGDIVTISDGADGQPVKECIVQIEPVQDLHGYDNPWPAGGGKNKFNQAVFSESSAYHDYFSSYYYTDTITLKPNTQYTFTPDSATAIDSGIYFVIRIKDGENFSSEDVFVYPIYNGNFSGSGVNNTITTGATGKIAFGLPSASGWQEQLTQIMSKKWQLEEGSTGTAWSPYSNICHISGHAGTNIYKTGVNTWDEEWENGYFSSAGVESSSTNAIRSVNFMPCLPNTAYFNYYGNSTGTLFMLWYDSEKTFISRVSDKNKAITSPSNAYYYKICTDANYGTAYANNISINFPATDTDYHPGNVTAYSVTLPTEAGTVYGGTVDLAAKTLTVDRASVDMGTLNWTAYNGKGFYASKADAKAGSNNLLCSTYKTAASSTDSFFSYETNNGCVNTYLNSSGFRAKDSAYTDAVTFKTAMTGQTLVYELAEPFTIQLDPVTITTLSGVNNIWSDTGEVAVTYPADTKAYIDESLPSVPVQDVQINGTSILSNGVANVPMGSSAVLGVVKDSVDYGTSISVASGVMRTYPATDANIKAGTQGYRPIVPATQHQSVFYALAKLAGADMASSSNAVGTYTDEAKAAIQTMLGTDAIVAPKEADLAHASQAYAIGDVFMANGKLYVATAAIAANDVINVGTNCVATNISEKFVKKTDYATADEAGVVKVYAPNGISIDSNKQLAINYPSDSQLKTGAAYFRPIVPALQHASTFYGLAKAAGDTTQSQSSNAVGTYTADAKAAIQKMLGIYDPPFELIRDITLSERTSVDISVDDNGLPFSLRSIYMEIYYDSDLITESSGYGRYNFYDSNNEYVHAETKRYYTKTNATFKVIYIERKSNTAFAHFTLQSDVGDSAAWRIKSSILATNGAKFGIGDIVRIAMSSNDYEPAGTRIKVYAQRAY